MSQARDERFEQLRPRFVRWLIASAGLLAVTMAATALTYGTEPFIGTSETERSVVALLGGTALIGVLFNGGMLLFERMLRRYGPGSR